MQDPQKKIPMRENSIFRIYSMTKPIISTVAMLLQEDGTLYLNESLEKILFCIDKIIEKENINPKRIYVGGNSQGGIMACKLALEHPDAIDGFIAHNAFLPIIYQTMRDKSKYSTLKGLVINGENDKTIKPINSKQITNTFIKLGANIKSIELQMGHEFPKLSRDLINEWIASK